MNKSFQPSFSTAEAVAICARRDAHPPIQDLVRLRPASAIPGIEPLRGMHHQ